MAKSGDGSGSIGGRTEMVIDAVSGVIVDAKGVVTPLPKAATKELRKLEKSLAAARKTESKRLRQLAAAQGQQGAEEIGKRRKQAEEAASDVASAASRIASIATSAAGSAVEHGRRCDRRRGQGRRRGGGPRSRGRSRRAKAAPATARKPARRREDARRDRTPRRPRRGREDRRSATTRKRAAARRRARKPAARRRRPRNRPPRHRPPLRRGRLRSRDRGRRPQARSLREDHAQTGRQAKDDREIDRQADHGHEAGRAIHDRAATPLPQSADAAQDRGRRKARDRRETGCRKASCRKASCRSQARDRCQARGSGKARDGRQDRRASPPPSGRGGRPRPTRPVPGPPLDGEPPPPARPRRPEARRAAPTRPRPDVTDPSRADAPPPAPRRVVGASVDLGSNSVHLLVAAVTGHRIEPLVDESAFLGLGSAVVERGFLGRAARAELTADPRPLCRHGAGARRRRRHVPRHRADPPRGRRRPDRPRGRRGDRRTAPRPVTRGGGVPHDHRRDRGAAGHPRDARRRRRWRQLGVLHRRCDAAASGGRSPGRVGAPDRPVRDARSADRRGGRLDARRRGARRSVAHRTRRRPSSSPSAARPRTWSRCFPRRSPTGYSPGSGSRRSRRSSRPSPPQTTSERLRHQPRPGAAPAGRRRDRRRASCDRYGADAIRVSEAGLREGVILAVEHAGPCWRDRLADLAHGWRA